jgi:hypothetical protein
VQGFEMSLQAVQSLLSRMARQNPPLLTRPRRGRYGSTASLAKTSLMVTPEEAGGLGVDVLTAAEVVGHQDKGETIARHYLKLNQREAARRIAAAMRRRTNRNAGQ